MPKIPVARTARLKNLEVTKIALVPAGSNPKAHVTFFKSKKDVPADPPTDASVKKATFDDIRGAREAKNALYKIYDACYDLQDAFYSTIYDGGNAGDDIRKSVKQFSAHVDNILDELASGSYAKADPNAIRKAVLEKMAEFASRIAPEEDDVKKTLKAKTTAKPVAKAETKLEDLSKEELIERVKKAEAAKPKAVEKSEEDEDEDDDEEDEVVEDLDEVTKQALPPSVVSLISKLTKSTKAASAAAAAATTLAKAEAEKRELGEYVQKARTVLKHLPGTAEDNGMMLMNLYKTMPKEQADVIVKSLEAGDAAMAMLGEETGTDQAVTGSALEQLNTIAKGMSEKDPKLTFEQAFAKACKQNVEIYKQHRRETKERSYAE